MENEEVVCNDLLHERVTSRRCGLTATNVASAQVQSRWQQSRRRAYLLLEPIRKLHAHAIAGPTAAADDRTRDDDAQMGDRHSGKQIERGA